MPSIPIDVLLEILEHVCETDLATLCRVNKIFCSYSRDVLYREIRVQDTRVVPTLAQSTDLARRVRSFDMMLSSPELATALKNMSSLRMLSLMKVDDASILDGCTFKLESFDCEIHNSESLQKFLKNQPSITDLALFSHYDPFPPFDQKCLPNLTSVSADSPWLGALIPGRPVREVLMFSTNSTDLSFLTLSTTPIQKLWIDDVMLNPNHVSLLVSIFPSLVHLVVSAYDVEWGERVRLYLSIY
jgi:F-box domain